MPCAAGTARAGDAGPDRGQAGTPPAGQARLAAEAAAAQQDAEQARQDKAARLEARARRRRAVAAALAAQADARVAGYQRRAAAKAVAGSAARPDGRVPVGSADSAAVRRARQAAAKAEQDLAAARAAPAQATEPARPLKANTTDPGSRVMPGKLGGFLQGYNPQVMAARGQVILSIATHDSPVDVRALHPALAAARANLDAARITDPIGAALFDAGYASDENFTAACEADLYVAITREARQTGRLRDGRQPQTMKESWQQMAARLDTPGGRALYKQRAAITEPVFAQSPAGDGSSLLKYHVPWRRDLSSGQPAPSGLPVS